MIMRWNDAYKTKSNKIVSMMSTKHVAELADTGKNHFQSKAEVRKPDVIVDYNRNMGSVDNLSRIIMTLRYKEKLEINGTERLENYSSKLQFLVHLLFSGKVIRLPTKVSTKIDSRIINLSWCANSKSLTW